jgi:toxin ParE1/3/4
VTRYRLSGPAKRDIAAILRVSEQHHGRDARIRYRACLVAAMRRVAADPQGHSTVERTELLPGLSSFHIRHSRDESDEAPVAQPVHIIFFRLLDADLVEIVRVLHERMEAGRHLGPEP